MSISITHSNNFAVDYAHYFYGNLTQLTNSSGQALGTAAFTASSAYDASGAGTTAATTAINSITSAWLTGKIGAGVYDASGAAANSTNAASLYTLLSGMTNATSLFSILSPMTNTTQLSAIGMATLSASTNAAAAVTNSSSTLATSLGGAGNTAVYWNGNGGWTTPAGGSAWVRQVIFGGEPNANTIATATHYGFVSSCVSLATSAIRAAAPCPNTGYLSNLVVFSEVAWPSTTNIVFTVMTNTGSAAFVNSALTCALSPAGGTAWTNSGTTSCVLSPGAENNFAMALNLTSSGGSLPAQNISWSVEWWHH